MKYHVAVHLHGTGVCVKRAVSSFLLEVTFRIHIQDLALRHDRCFSLKLLMHWPFLALWKQRSSYFSESDWDHLCPVAWREKKNKMQMRIWTKINWRNIKETIPEGAISVDTWSCQTNFSHHCNENWHSKKPHHKPPRYMFKKLLQVKASSNDTKKQDKSNSCNTIRLY